MRRVLESSPDLLDMRRLNRACKPQNSPVSTVNHTFPMPAENNMTKTNKVWRQSVKEPNLDDKKKKKLKHRKDSRNRKTWKEDNHSGTEVERRKRLWGKGVKEGKGAVEGDRKVRESRVGVVASPLDYYWFSVSLRVHQLFPSISFTSPSLSHPCLLHPAQAPSFHVFLLLLLLFALPITSLHPSLPPIYFPICYSCCFITQNPHFLSFPYHTVSLSVISVTVLSSVLNYLLLSRSIKKQGRADG